MREKGIPAVRSIVADEKCSRGIYGEKAGRIRTHHRPKVVRTKDKRSPIRITEVRSVRNDQRLPGDERAVRRKGLIHSAWGSWICDLV